MEPATDCLIKNIEDICIYCGHELDLSKSRKDFIDTHDYIMTDCSVCGRENRTDKTKKTQDNTINHINILMVEYPNRRKVRIS